MRFRATLLVLVLCCLIPAVALAQTVNVTSGSINGKVTDSTGAVLPGVSVTATSLDTGLKRTVVSEKDGTYVISLLQPGKYRVDAELSGLGKAAVGSVDVLLGNSTRADLKIAPQVTETVEVVATSVDASRTGTAVSVTSDQIANLPIIGRDFRSLASLTPGVVDTFGGRVTANGARGIATDYNIDGATSNNDFFGENTGGTRAPFTFSQSAIREFQVVRSQYDAEYGRGVGAQINAITKSGTNDLHGEGFLFRRSRLWASKRDNWLGPCGPVNSATGTPSFTDPAFPFCRPANDSFRAKDSTQGGMSIGGPISRNQVFFFANFDSQRQKLPIQTTDIRTQTTGFLTLSPADQTAVLTKLEGLIGRPYDEREFRYDQTFDQNTFLGKVDMNVGANSRVSIRNNYTNFENANNQTAGNFSNQGVENDKFNQLVGTMTTVLGNSRVNEALVEFSLDERPINPVSSSTEIAVTGLLNSGSTFFGANDFLPNNTRERKLQLKDTFRLIRGNHSLKIGGEAVLVHIDNLFPRRLNGVFTYNSVAAYLADTPSSFQQGYGPGGGETSWNMNTFAVYFSDNMRVNSRFTVDYGLRYDTQTMPKPETNVFPQHSEFVNQIKQDLNNVAPRFGFAYDLSGNGRSVLRGGGGRFFGYMPAILMSNPLTQISGNFLQGSITCATATIVPCPTYPNILTPAQFAQLGLAAGTDIVTVAKGYGAQEAWRSSLQYERQFTKGYSASVSVIASRMSKVQGSRNINAVSSGISLAGMPIYDLNTSTRKYTDMGVVRELCSCENASYKALTFETARLTSTKMLPSWNLSYTLASAIDQDSNERSTSTSFLYDPLNPRLSEGPADSDVRHRFVGSAIYRLPYGIQLAGIFQARSGVPYTPGIAYTNTGVPGNPNSLNGLSQMSGNIPVFVNGSGDVINLVALNTMFNGGTAGPTRAEFSNYLTGQNARIIGRNAYRQPGVNSLDLRISKTFDISTASRSMQVQVIAEGFNVLYAKPEFIGNMNQYRASFVQATGRYTFTSLEGDKGFGKTTGYNNTPEPRQGQVAVKFIF